MLIKNSADPKNFDKNAINTIVKKNDEFFKK